MVFYLFRYLEKWIALKCLGRVNLLSQTHVLRAQPLITTLPHSCQSAGGIAQRTEYTADIGKEQLLDCQELEIAREKGAVTEGLTTKPDKGKKRWCHS